VGLANLSLTNWNCRLSAEAKEKTRRHPLEAMLDRRMPGGVVLPKLPQVRQGVFMLLEVGIRGADRRFLLLNLVAAFAHKHWCTHTRLHTHVKIYSLGHTYTLTHTTHTRIPPPLTHPHIHTYACTHSHASTHICTRTHTLHTHDKCIWSVGVCVGVIFSLLYTSDAPVLFPLWPGCTRQVCSGAAEHSGREGHALNLLFIYNKKKSMLSCFEPFCVHFVGAGDTLYLGQGLALSWFEGWRKG
jgi:hypothetical protein